MTTAYDRRWAQTAAQVRARATQLADRWEHAERRQPRNGHRAECPDRLAGPARRCRHCIADVIGREERERAGGRDSNPEPHRSHRPMGAPRQPDHRTAEMRACRTCFAPTTTPEEHCT